MAELAFTAQDPGRDFMRETPRNLVLGYLSDLAAKSYSPERTQQMQGVAKFFGAPAISQTLDRMAHGEPLTTGSGGIGGTSKIRPEVADAAMSVMDFLPQGGFAKGAAMAAPMMAGTFIGKKAATWDALAAAKAKMMTDIGVDARTIWKETGTWKGPDGKWRQEIPDNNAAFVAKSSRGGATSEKLLEEAIKHEELYRAYPYLSKVRTGWQYGNDKFADSSYQIPSRGGDLAFGDGVYQKIIPEGIGISQPEKDKTKAASNYIHEITHSIQSQEKFNLGGKLFLTPEQKVAKVEATEQMKSALKGGDIRGLMMTRNGYVGTPITESDKTVLEAQTKLRELNQTEFENYRRLAGEAEARATQARIPLDAAQRRALFPEDSYDVPLDQLIIR